MKRLTRSWTIFPAVLKGKFSVMHKTDSIINLVYNLLEELRLSRDMFGDEMYFTYPFSLHNNSTFAPTI
jgi:hypothetical protein